MRTVRQVHFNAWPDFGCPPNPADLLSFAAMIRAIYESECTQLCDEDRIGPIVVHCRSVLETVPCSISARSIDLLLLYFACRWTVVVFDCMEDILFIVLCIVSGVSVYPVFLC